MKSVLWLFTGASQPGYLDACDADGDTQYAFSDNIALRQYLFKPDTLTIPFPGSRDCGPVREGACVSQSCTPQQDRHQLGSKEHPRAGYLVLPWLTGRGCAEAQP